MDGATIYGVVTGSIGTALSVFLLCWQITTERAKLAPYITDWVTIPEAEGHLVVKVRVVVPNKSRVANTVERILIKSRGEKDFCFEPFKLVFLNDGKAYASYLNSSIEEISKSVDLLPLPANIEAKQSVSGWLGFVISPEYVEKAKKQKWCLKVFDQSGKSYLSSSDRDRIVT